MSVISQTTVHNYTGNGSQTIFPYSFYILDKDDLQVYVNTVLVTNYSLDLTSLFNPIGGNVIFTSAPSNGAAIKIQRKTTLDRSTDYLTYGKLDAEVLDADLDRVVMMVQDVARDIVAGSGTVSSVGVSSGASTAITVTNSPITTTGTINIVVDPDLDAIAALTASTGYLKKTAANTWALDTNVITQAAVDVEVTRASNAEATLQNNINAEATLRSNADATLTANLNTEITRALAAEALLQPLDGDLTAIAGLAGTSGLARKTAANTWTLDTSTFLTNNQTITLSGDATGSGSTAITVTLNTVPATKGGTGASTYATGDTLYSSATNTLSKLSGNTSTTKQFLSQTGNGSISAAPVWSVVSKSDVGLSVVENTALSTWAGSTNITTLGTIATGSWNATAIPVNKGGTGQTALGTSLQVLRTNAAANGTEWATISGGSGSPAGGDKEIQYNSAGAFGASSTFTYDVTSNSLQVGGTTVGGQVLIPVVPSSTSSVSSPAADTLSIFSRKIAGRVLPKWIGPSGVDTPFQPALFGNNIAMFSPASGTTGTGTALGHIWTSSGTVTHPTPINTAPAISNQMARTRYANVATTTNQQLGPRGNTAAEQKFWRGNAAGLGGFFYFSRFVVESYPGSTIRIFSGLTNGGSVTASVCISDTVVANTCGLWHDTTDPSTGAGAFNFVTRNATTTTKQQITLSNAIAAGNSYDFYMFAKPNDTVIYWRLEDLVNNVMYEGSQTSTLPVSTVFMGPQCQMSNGTANILVNIVAIGVNKVYCESDH